MARSLGILKADSVNPDLQVQHGDYTDMFVSVLGEADPDLRFHIYDVTQFEYPDDLDDCDGYLIREVAIASTSPSSGLHDWANSLLN